MKPSVQDETLFAVGEHADTSKPRRGRPRIHADDAARKRAFNQRRAEAHARARAAERRAKRWRDRAKELDEQLRAAVQRTQTLERLNSEHKARLLARIDRLERQLAQAVRRREWALERRSSALTENRELREELRRAWRAVRRLEANPGLGPLAARVRE